MAYTGDDVGGGGEPGGSEAWSRLVVDAARDYAILTVDPAGTITSWSPGAETVFGWSAGEALGRDAAMTFIAEDRAAGRPERERAIAGAEGSVPDVRWHLRRDGRRIFIEGVMRRLPMRPGGRAASSRSARTSPTVAPWKPRWERARHASARWRPWSPPCSGPLKPTATSCRSTIAGWSTQDRRRRRRATAGGSPPSTPTIGRPHGVPSRGRTSGRKRWRRSTASAARTGCSAGSWCASSRCATPRGGSRGGSRRRWTSKTGGAPRLRSGS